VPSVAARRAVEKNSTSFFLPIRPQIVIRNCLMPQAKGQKVKEAGRLPFE
jgi:hypothetical protein